MSDYETKILQVNLPSFFVNFKDNSLAYILTYLNKAIGYFQQTDDTLVVVLIFLIVIELIRIAINKSSNIEKEGNYQIESKKLEKEFKDLKKQVKSIQTKLHELKGSISKGFSSGRSSGANPSPRSLEKVRTIMRDSWQSRSEIITDILTWQFKIIKQVTKLKNKLKGSKIISKSSISKINTSKSKLISNGEDIHKLKMKETKSIIINNQIKRPLPNESKENASVPKQATKVPLSKLNQDNVINKKDHNVEPSIQPIKSVNIISKVIQKKEEIMKLKQQNVLSRKHQNQYIEKVSVSTKIYNQQPKIIPFNHQKHENITFTERQSVNNAKVDEPINLANQNSQDNLLMNQSESFQRIRPEESSAVEFKPMKKPSPPKFNAPTRAASGIPAIKKQGKKVPPPPPPRR